MKVGDIVRQHGINIKGRGVSDRLGVVVKVEEIPDDIPEKIRKNMESIVGRTITVMWDSGQIHENFSEKMLEVIVESD
tara:strand:+ start:416 stop:649 length:234 start_codon:yes stop_codon:yes gene_type:complete